MKFLSYTLLFLFYGTTVFSQNMAKDTFNIKEIEISKTRTQLFSDANKKDEVDTTLLKFYANDNLSYLLKASSSVSITSYGSYGAASSVKIRGGGSVHTQVLWNGIPINSLTTGDADLSMINVGAFNQINVIYGASGSLYGSGTFGGAIELNNHPEFIKKQELKISADAGSFSNYRGRISTQLSNSKLYYTGQLFYGYGKNDYKYTDNQDFGSPEETAVNAENAEYGTIHSLFIKHKRNSFNAGFWYQAKDHNIPGQMGIGNPKSFQNQKDSTLKSYIGWQYIADEFQVNAQSAFIYDGLLYTNKDSANGDYTIYSQIASKRWLNLINSRYYLNSKLILSGQLKYDYLIGDVSTYGGIKYENEEDISLALKYTQKNFLINASASKNWNTLTSPPVMYSISSLYRLIPETLCLRIKVSTNYRKPTFNERYWPPGNPSIKPEEGIYYELGTKVGLINKDNHDLIVDINYYNSKNKNQIAWKTMSGGSVSENIDNVLSQGLEFNGKYNFNIFNFDFTFHLSYTYSNTQYNNPDNSNYKKTLYYHPKHIARNNILIKYKKTLFAINNSYQSVMYSPDRIEMDAIYLTNLQMGYNLNIRSFNSDLKFTTENIFNTSYQTIYAYPMPGRSYWFGITININ